MDSWPQDQQRHKACALRELLPPSALLTGEQRTFDEMSQPTTFSPPPFFFGHSGPSAPLDLNRNQFERRRTSHPHNEASQTSFASQSSMSEPRPPPRPSLEHRTSQTIIDLTEDSSESPPDGVNARFIHRRPHLGRSDALALEDIIDLTNDLVDDEVEFVESRPASARPEQQAQQGNSRQHRHLPHPRHRHRFLRDNSPLFVPEDDIQLTGVHSTVEDGYIFRPFSRLPEGLGGMANFMPAWAQEENLRIILGAHQRMPNLDYNQHPFARPRQPPKPQHQPPLVAKEGFTRSPKDDDVVICPACQKELIAKKGENEAPLKKPGGKTPNKKDREEHPFWVVKECGHVYCNGCYQRRRSDKKNISPFPEAATPAGRTHPICAVEDCEKDVGDKKYWVGVFI